MTISNFAQALATFVLKSQSQCTLRTVIKLKPRPNDRSIVQPIARL